MQTMTDYPFTRTQFEKLTEEQHIILDCVARLLSGDTLPQNPSDEILSEIFNLLKPSPGPVPNEEIGDSVSSAIRKKFYAVYRTGLELAEAELHRRGLKPSKECTFCLVVEPEDVSHVVIIDHHQPICYLDEWQIVRKFHFHDLAALAQAVVQVNGAASI